jgi:hypothetical protein
MALPPQWLVSGETAGGANFVRAHATSASAATGAGMRSSSPPPVVGGARGGSCSSGELLL